MEDRKYYVYVWFFKNTDKIFYVGKGNGNRCKARKRKDNPKFTEIVLNNECDYKIIKNGLTEDEAFALEIKTISYYRSVGEPLINILDGGKNPPSNKGISKSDDWKEKASKSMVEFYNNHPERKKFASEKMKDFLKTEKGKEFQRKSIESRNNDEFRKRQSEICRKANNTPEYLKKQSEIVKNMWKSDDYRNSHCGVNNPRAHGVVQFDLNGNYIKEYDTITQASKETGVCLSKISAVAMGKRKTSGGYIWKYKECI